MKRLIFILLLFSNSQNVEAQNVAENYILSGTVVDGISNQTLSGANIISTHNIGTKTNELGEFEIIVYHNDTLQISFVGFKTLHYIVPEKVNGKYLIKFKLFTDSIVLDEIEIFSWPTYEEFKEAFLLLDKTDEKLEIKGVKTYQDRSINTTTPSVFNPVSYIYDRLFDKQAKLKRRLDKNRATIRNKEIDKSP